MAAAAVEELEPLLAEGVETVEGGAVERQSSRGTFRPPTRQDYTDIGNEVLGKVKKASGTVAKATGKVVSTVAVAGAFYEGVKDVYHDITKTVHHVNTVTTTPTPPSSGTDPIITSPGHTFNPNLDYNPPPININVYGGKGAGVPRYPHEPVHRGRRPKSRSSHHRKKH
jgi:hypothetical protein